MKKTLFFLIPLSLILSSCTFSNDKNEGLIDQENLNIITDINELAINTFFSNNKTSIDEELEDVDLDFTPKVKSDVKEDIIKNVEKLIERDPKARWVYDNYYNLSNVEAYLTGNDPDTIEFVYNLNNGNTDFPKEAGESENLGRQTPYYIQWDDRWGYDHLPPRNVGISGCGPTSMAMILSRLEDDKTITPDKIAKDAISYMTNEGIAWNFFADEASKYNYQIKDINLDEEEMKRSLEEGPLLVSVKRGYFTLFGHIFVIDSYKDGKFIINDPNSIKNTIRPWTFDEIKDQIVHIWQIY